MYCGKCGKFVPDDDSFCGKCGAHCNADSENSKNTGNTQSSADFSQFAGANYSDAFDAGDVQANKVPALLAYLLFFIPLIICPNSKFGRFHANQGLILFILAIINSMLQGIFGFWNLSRGFAGFWNFNWLFNPFLIITGAISFVLLAAIVYGMVNAANGKAVEIPLIGKFRIIT
jgi:uncharacterized membrane protein